MDIQKDKTLTDFAARLNLTCDYMGVPEKGRARQLAMARLFGVSQKAARKWLEGEGFPTLDKTVRLAVWSDVAVDWLLTGRGPRRVPAVDPGVVDDLPASAPDDVRRLASRIAALSPARREALLRLLAAFGV